MTWEERPLGKVVRFRRGHDLPDRVRIPGSVPVIGSAGPNGWHNEARAIGPGVSIGRSGASIGKVTYTKVDYWPHNACLYVTDFLGNHPRFVYYFLQTKLSDLTALNSGAAQPSLNRNFVHAIPVRIPGWEEQSAIAGVLSAYDDLIETNRQRIALLEEWVRKLHREWLVRLNFPGHQHAKTMDGIPNGWEEHVLGDLVENVKQSVKPSDFESEDIHVGLEHIPRRAITIGNWGHAEGLASAKWRFEEGDILFGKIRPYFHKVGFAIRRGLASSDAFVWRVHDELDWPLVLCATSSDHFVSVASKTVREGSKMPRADWSVLRDYVIHKPPISLMRTFNTMVQAVTQQCKVLALQNRSLAEARDLLLPRLMNGEISM